MQVTFPPGAKHLELYVPSAKQQRAIEYQVQGRFQKALLMFYDVVDKEPLRGLAAARPCLVATGDLTFAVNMAESGIWGAKRCGYHGLTRHWLLAGLLPPHRSRPSGEEYVNTYERLPTYEEACSQSAQQGNLYSR